MKFKLDENFGRRTVRIFAARGLDADTVADEKICGAADDELFATCAAEKRILVTLDTDFCDILRFPPERSAGIAVIRAGQNPTLPLLEDLIEMLLRYFATDGGLTEERLWVVEPGRIRIRSGAP